MLSLLHLFIENELLVKSFLGGVMLNLAHSCELLDGVFIPTF
jgi:hypothetical protein